MSDQSTKQVSLNQAWDQSKARIERKLGNRVFESWYSSVQVDVEKSSHDRLCLSVANRFLAIQASQPMYLPVIVSEVSRCLGRDVEVKFIVRVKNAGKEHIYDPEADLTKAAPTDIFSKPPPAPTAGISMVRYRRKRATRSSSPSLPVRPTGGSDVEGTKDNPSSLSDLVELVFRSHRLQRRAFLVLVSKFYGFTPKLLESSDKTKDLVWARQVGMSLINLFIDSSHREIGEVFGGRDKTTVLYNLNRCAELREEFTEKDEEVSRIEEAVRIWLEENDQK